MNDIQTLEFWIIRELQNSDEWMTPVMQLFTWLGYPQAYILFIAIIYWSFNSRLGIRMAIFLPVAASINGILKLVFHAPRPFWVNPEIKTIQAVNSFGMPSGHAQAATVWLLVAHYLKWRWFWIVAVIITFMVGLSRAYLGAHFPSQIILGWIIGIILIVCFISFENKIKCWMRSRGIVYQILIVLGISILMILAGGIFVLNLEGWEMPSAWIRNASLHIKNFDNSPVSPIGFENIVGNAGGFLGSALGIILIDRLGEIDARGIWWKRMLRSIIGLTLIVGFYKGLLTISPEENNNIWKFVGFFIIAFSVMFLIPVLYLKTRLVSPLNKITSK